MSWIEIMFSSGFAMSLLMWLLDRRKRNSEIEKIKSEIIDTDVARAHESAEEWKNLAQCLDVEKKVLSDKIDTLYTEKARDRELYDKLFQDNAKLKVENTRLESMICLKLKCIDRDPPFLNNLKK